MKLETLNEFVVLVKHRNYTSAAKELYLSQPSLSTHIAKLEADLDALLIERSDGAFTLTPAGMAFLGYAQQIIAAYEEAKEECKNLSFKGNPLKIANVSPDSTLKQILNGLSGVPYSFVDLDYETSELQALERGLIDIGSFIDFSEHESIRKQAEASGIAMVPLGKARVALCMTKTNPLAQNKILKRSHLADATIAITSGAWYDHWQVVVKKALGENLGLKFKLKPTGHLSNLSRLDLENDIYLCGYSSVFECFSSRDDVVIYDKIDGEDITYSSALVYNKDNECAAKLAKTLSQKLT